MRGEPAGGRKAIVKPAFEPFDRPLRARSQLLRVRRVQHSVSGYKCLRRTKRPQGIKRPGRGSLLLVMASRGFEETVLPHLDAAFNYARWLTRSDPDAEDVVQDACVRALRFLPSLREPDARAWFLAIVRNAWYSRIARRTTGSEVSSSIAATVEPVDSALDPEDLLSQQQAVAQVRNAIEQLPADFREVIVLREIEGFSYKQIAAVVNIPIGTVMSRLARARERLAAVLKAPLQMEETR